MIEYNLISKSNLWSFRIKKSKLLIKKILKYQKELKFNKNINYICNIVLIDNYFIKKLNFKFRKKNQATDVLTFISETKNPKGKLCKVCDIFLSAEMIKKDSQKNGINFYNHLSHLIIHSFLHVNGFVHNTINDFNKMKKAEIEILNKIGIINPYE